ncbi:MAG: RloB domain-containing protein [Lewinellaceae bacterium]|nr:RloB domain-containing protein [Saprospiraceae bacterium]MCB9341941.1 RloB domain-containing protein [Lewinellaceae bacterium]
MPRTENRSYKKSTGKHRDARCFFIIAEGEREEDYFLWFEQKSKRIRVEIIEREGKASAPKHMLGRLQKFLPENAVQPGDQIWFVLDVDRWERESIEELRSLCTDYPGWATAISNPCFEVWLLFHFNDKISGKATASKEFKQLLHEVTPGGYSIVKFAPKIESAAANARDADPTPEHDYPDTPATTKVYRLADEMLKFLGRNWG